MNTPTRLGAYALGLVAVFGASAGLGAAVGPTGPTGSTGPTGPTGSEAFHGSSHGSAVPAGGDLAVPATPEASTGGHGGGHGDAAAGASGEDVPGGLMVSRHGYTLALDDPALPAGADAAVSFRILGPDGAPVTAFEKSHDEEVHLIAVRRDMSGFRHVHPSRGGDGTWSVPLDLSAAGEYRLFADFVPAEHGEGITLGADLSVAGDYNPLPLPAPSRTAEVDGYTVTLDGRLVPGEESELTLSVSRGGAPVTDLQPYLAAYGHLVALRDGDLAYLHVHPDGSPGDGTTRPGPDITFHATAPTAGDYRLFLDFRHGGAVRTAELTARAGAPGASSEVLTSAPPGAAEEHGDDAHGH